MICEPVILKRSVAKAMGLLHYHNGKPCPAGHMAERFVSTGTCRACLREKTKAWQAIEENKQWNRDHANKWSKDHRVEKTIYERIWRSGNRHKVAIYNERRRIQKRKNPDGFIHARALAMRAGKTHYSLGIPCRNGHMARRYTSSGSCELCSREKSIELHKRNPLLRRAISSRRRARRLGAGGSHTAKELALLLKRQQYRCVYCRVSIREKYHADHIVSIARGGSDNIGNIQALCQPCNQRKHAKDPLVFARELGMLI